ncbi:ABC transporter substrate-binding protein [Rubeoparvulum massiliense]|uniref:ABC transporter substrate-binding protein n=1 Tax=Rubeoparvulum massiliense TaxID=1631346 RepID=UPI00069EE63F|nr:ABC transporter substrate-binding protein [Rubeoparvulum massiliense]
MRLRLIAFLLCFTLLLAGCQTNSSGEGDEPIPVRLFEVTHSLFYAPQYVALELGFFKEEGLDVQLTTAFGGDKTMTALLSGEADIILVGTETTIYVAQQEASDLAINFAQLTQTDGTFLVSREPIENFQWEMLRGRVLLGQRKGGMPQMVSEYVQHVQGLVPHEDLEIIQNIDFANLGTAFISGTGEFAQLFEPVASKIELEGHGHVVASFGESSGNLPYTVYITKASMIEQNPTVVQQFTNAIYRAQIWVNEHSIEELAQVIQPAFPDIEQELLIKVLERYKNQGSWATDPIIDETEYHHLEEVMELAGELPKKVPYELIINTQFAKAAMEQGR